MENCLLCCYCLAHFAAPSHDSEQLKKTIIMQTTPAQKGITYLIQKGISLKGTEHSVFRVCS